MQGYRKLRQQLRRFKHRQRQPRKEVEARFQKVAQKLNITPYIPKPQLFRDICSQKAKNIAP